jgi:hypothetical protein
MEKITSTHEYIEVFYSFLLQDDEYKFLFKSLFQTKCPSIYADIESFSSNPNCSCKDKIKNYVVQHKEEMADIVNDFFKDKEENALEIFINKIKNKVPVNLSGKILKTTIKNWESFCGRMKKNNFHSFSVTKEGEDLYVFFL